MKIKQYCWQKKKGWDEEPIQAHISNPTLILAFGSVELIKKGECLKKIRKTFPDTPVMGCSTAGEIIGTAVTEDCFIATVISFQHSTIAGKCVTITDFNNSEDAGKALAKYLPTINLKHVFVLADGLLTNGSEIVRGMASILPDNVPITGGLAGDSIHFSQTYVICNNTVKQGTIAAVGFYGNKLKIGYGSRGGWRPFGPEKLITASKGNTLFELEGELALDLYKKYLGSEACNLPASGLLFPLSIRTENETPVVRSILAVDEEQKSLYFAGDMPVGYYARLMRAAADDLIDGAIEAAEIATAGNTDKPELAILISCMARKGVLHQLTEEETEGVKEVLGSTPVMTGFYSYGEIAPFGPGHKAVLHNQTMTITTIFEDE